jgi:EmrB/QacA subfamily drug resistance transporter
VIAILGSSMAFIDGTVVNVALPVLQSDFRATISQVQWVIESYSLFLTALVLVGGALGDQIGRRLTFSMGVVIFSAASLWCGLSSEIRMLILARGIQGIGAAMLVPGSLAMLSAAYPEAERGRAIGTWSGFSGLTAAIGPVLGGWFVQTLSWRWAFFINVPIGALVLILVLVHLPTTQETGAGSRLDWLGAATVTISLALVVYGLLELPARGWRSTPVVATVIGGTVGMAMFVAIESKVSNPMMPVDLFHSKNFGGANLLTLLLYAALSGALFFVPFNLIQVQGYSPVQAGSALLPFVLIMFLLSRWAGGLVTRFGARGPLTIGPIVTALGFVLFAIPSIGGSYWRTVFPAVTVLGLGMVTTVAPLTTTVMESVRSERSGAASGINNAVARLAGLLAIALLGLTIQSAFAARLNQQMDALNLSAGLQEQIRGQRGKLAAIEVPSSLDGRMRTRIQHSIDESFIAAFRRVVLVCAALASAAALAAAITIQRSGNRVKQRQGRRDVSARNL